MDLYCRTCGEPWDSFYVWDEMTPQEQKDFRAGKCPACPAGAPRRPMNQAAEMAGIIMDLLGDDEDGAAALMEDAERLGYMTYD